MKSTNTHPTGGRSSSLLRVLIAGFTLAGLALLARAALPLAGTPIGNQASATYKDDSGTSRTVLSNTVTTLVQQVYGLELQQNNDRTGTPGGQVFFPHTVTNLGNGIDTIALVAVTTGATQLTNVHLYVDADGDGNPDNFTDITSTGPLAPGASFRFIVTGIVPPSAAVPSTGGVTVTATSPNGGGTPIAVTNNDTLTITSDAVMQVNKEISVSSGVPGTTITYKITYRNTGNSPATDFTITDTLAAPAALGYVDDSAKWSVFPSTPLTDDSGDTETATGIDYNFTSNKATFKIASVPAGVSGFVTFQVKVANGVAPQIVNNTARYAFETGSGPTSVGPLNTNTVPFTVLPVVGVTFTGETVNTAPAGGTVVFHNTLTNTGTGTDTFDITIDPATTKAFPDGTSFQLFKSDGFTPLVDTNSNGKPDTGPVATGAGYVVVLKATLPGDTPTGTNVDYQVNKIAVSSVDPLAPAGTATANDILENVTGAGVDLRGSDNVLGTGTGPEGSAVEKVAGNPGSTAVFTLNVNNTGPNPDTFNLLASATTAFGNVSSLATGWTVVFKDAGGTVVSNTGVIGAGQSKTYTAEIGIPAGTSPGDVAIYFQSKSPTTGATDALHDAVSVNTVRGITLQTNNVGQTFPGGSVVYEHILTNTGNVTEGNTGGSTLQIQLSDTLNGAGFTSVVYYDANNNGVIDGGDVIVDTAAATVYLSSVKTAGLTKGEAVRLLVKVQAPLGANDGAVNITTLKVTPAGTIASDTSVAAPAVVSNTDTTSVIRGNLTILKEQSLDGTTWGTTQLSANPGARIYYRLTVTNVGSATSTNIVINDTVPANTTYDGTYTPTVSIAGTSTPSAFSISGNDISVALVNPPDDLTLAPTKTIVITFAVTIDGAGPI